MQCSLLKRQSGFHVAFPSNNLVQVLSGLPGEMDNLELRSGTGGVSWSIELQVRMCSEVTLFLSVRTKCEEGQMNHVGRVTWGQAVKYTAVLSRSVVIDEAILLVSD